MNFNMNLIDYNVRQHELQLDAAKVNGAARLTNLPQPDSPLQALVRRWRKLLQPWSATRRDGFTLAGA